MWCVLVRWYHFGRISILERWILRDLDGSDLVIPVQVSELLWTVRSRSNG
jgi:hypothetical protein